MKSMSMFDGIKKLILGSAIEDEEDDYGTEETAAAEPEASTPAPEKSATRSFDRVSAASEPKRSSKVLNIRNDMKLSVVLVKPERYEEVAEIAVHLKNTRTVVLNLEKANREVARRILDFLSGVAYIIDGNLKMIATNTYIITPVNVDIQGELMDELEAGGLYL